MASPEERFWAKVDRSAGPDGCWPWTGAKKGKGYGHLFVDGHFEGAHRFSLELALGRRLGSGMQANHTCDNPPCVNPAHLYEGTGSENGMDASRRGALNFPRARGDRNGSRAHPETLSRGERINTAKLTEEAVREIRRLSADGLSSVVLGATYGVASSTVQRIVARKYWRHVS